MFRFLGFLLVLDWWSTTVSGSRCLTSDGYDVTWWAVFRRPSSHFYFTIDSENDDVTELLHPWGKDSPLQATVEGADLGSETTDVLTYYTDYANLLLEGANSSHVLVGGMIAHDFGYVSSTGFWIIHNNSYFPPREGDTLITDPRDPRWAVSLTDDPMAQGDPFYFCTTIDNKKHLEEMVDVWLMSNPTLGVSDVKDDFWTEKLEVSFYPGVSFHYHTALKAAFACFYSNTRELIKNCLRQYSNKDAGLQMLVRMRSLTIHNVQPCMNFIRGFDEHGWPKWDLQYKPWQEVQQVEIRNVFAISNSLVCFGNDIAVNPDVTALMVCVAHPRLATWLLSTRHSVDLSCKELLVERFKQGIGINPIPSPVASRGHCTKTQCATQKKSDTRQQATTTQDEKSDTHDAPFIGTPTTRQQIQYIDRQDELTTYVLENVNNVLAIFCRKGCRYCDTMDDDVSRLADQIWPVYDTDIVVVDIMIFGFPPELNVDETPTVRYRPKLKDDIHMEWFTVSEGIPTLNELTSVIDEIHAKLEDWDREDESGGDTQKKNDPPPQDRKEPIEKPHRRVKRNTEMNDNVCDDQNAKPSENARTRQQNKQRNGNQRTCQQQGKPPVLQIRCASSLRQDGYKGVTLEDIKEELEPPDKTNCRGDKRRMFYDANSSGCTVLKASLVCRKTKDQALSEIYRAVCVNGLTITNKKYDEMKPEKRKKIKVQYHAEGHLSHKIDEDDKEWKLKELIKKKEIKPDGGCQLWIVLNYNPCCKSCSGANQGGPRNIPQVIENVRNILGSDIQLEVKIAFASIFMKRDESEKGKESEKAAGNALRAMIKQGYTLALCNFTDLWWRELEESREDSCKQDGDKIHDDNDCTEVRNEKQRRYDEDLITLNNMGLSDSVQSKESCVYSSRRKAKDAEFLIDPDWT